MTLGETQRFVDEGRQNGRMGGAFEGLLFEDHLRIFRHGDGTNGGGGFYVENAGHG